MFLPQKRGKSSITVLAPGKEQGSPGRRTIHIHGKAHSSTPTETSRTSLRQCRYILRACVQFLHSSGGYDSRIYSDLAFHSLKRVRRGSCRSRNRGVAWAFRWHVTIRNHAARCVDSTVREPLRTTVWRVALFCKGIQIRREPIIRPSQPVPTLFVDTCRMRGCGQPRGLPSHYSVKC